VSPKTYFKFGRQFESSLRDSLVRRVGGEAKNGEGYGSIVERSDSIPLFTCLDEMKRFHEIEYSLQIQNEWAPKN
jgi:hypothetical protein